MGERLIAIGDIHGCLHTLKNLLKKVSYDNATDILVFVGDYIDRGLFSCEVVSFLRKLQNQVGKNRCVCLRGNHEQFAIDSNGAYDDLWDCNGGYATLGSYERNGVDITDDVAWFKSLPLVYDTPEIIFCHAGLSHPRLKDNTPDDLLWGREWIEQDTEEREKQVVFGHTPNKHLSYVTSTGDICIDSGCVFNGALCALVIQENGYSECVYTHKSMKDEYL